MLPTYEKALRQLYTPKINGLLIELRQYKTRINTYLDTHAFTPKMKLDAERVQSISTLCSCRIDGISTTDARLQEMMEAGSDPKTTKEREIASYRFTLNTIEDSYPYIKVSTGAISQMHRDLYRYQDAPYAGRWEDLIEGKLREGEVGKLETRLASMILITKQSLLRDACINYKEAIASGACDPLIATFMFVLDFLNIHPFMEGNGRLSRLLTLLLLYKNDYFVCGWASLSEQIEQSKPAYTKAIDSSKRVIPEGCYADQAETDYEAFVEFMLERLLKCCKKFEDEYHLTPVLSSSQTPLSQRDENLDESGNEEGAKTKRNPRDVSLEERRVQRAAMQQAAKEVLLGHTTQKSRPLGETAGLRQEEEAEAPGLLANPPKRVPETKEERLAKRAEMQANAKAALDNSRQTSPQQNQGQEQVETQAQKAAQSKAAVQPEPKVTPQEATAPQSEASQQKASTTRKRPAAKGSNEEIVRNFFANLEGSASKKAIVAACPEMSPKTVERMLQKLLAEGTIEKIGAARSTEYQRA